MIAPFKMKSLFSILKRNFSVEVNQHYIEKLIQSTKGINLTNLEEAIKYSPELCNYTPAQWQSCHNFLVQIGFRSENFIALVANYPAIFRQSEKDLYESMNCWRSAQFGERNAIALLEKYPQLLNYNEHTKLSIKIDFLQNYVETKKNVWHLFMTSPNLIMDKNEHIEPKIKYLKNKMRVDIEEVIKSSVFSHSLEKIRCRHLFLERLGLYKPRNKKDDPTVLSKNPKLHQIMDTNDKKFATKIAFVTLDEYETFEKLLEKKLSSNKDMDELSDEE